MPPRTNACPSDAFALAALIAGCSASAAAPVVVPTEARDPALTVSIAPPPKPTAPPPPSWRIVGVVDMERAATETMDGLRAKAQLKALFDEKQAQLNRLQATLMSERDSLERESKVLAKPVIEERTRLLQQHMTELQATTAEMQAQLKRKEEELMRPILEKLTRSVDRVAHEQGVFYIVDKRSMPYADPSSDFTSLVIAAYNALP